MDILEQVDQLLKSGAADAPANWQVGLLLTDLLGEPVQRFAVTQAAGRAVLLEYEPVNAPDPDIALLTTPDGWRVNAAIGLLQRHRGRRDLPPADWYSQGRRLLLHIEALLARLPLAADERELVLSWAAGVVSNYRLLLPPVSPGFAWGAA